MNQTTSIPGYAYASKSLPPSPVSLEDLKFLEQAAGFSEEDVLWLRKAGTILSPQAEEIVDSWRSVIASQPHLAKFFFGPDGKPVFVQDSRQEAFCAVGHRRLRASA